jgi:branched-chain amino acid transport system substrate-binding protein
MLILKPTKSSLPSSQRFPESLMRRTRVFIPVLALTFAVVAAACGSSSESGTKGPIAVASIASSTGSASAYGIAQQNGTVLAVTELANGSIDLSTYDDLSDSQAGTDAMKKALSEGATVVLGPTLSPVAAAANPFAQAAGVPVLGVTNATLDMAAIGNLIWRVSLSENAMVSASVNYAESKRSVKTATLIWEPSDGYSAGSAASFRAAAKANGITITSEQAYVDGSTAVGAVAGAALASSPDAVFFALRSAVADDFLVATASTKALRVGGNGFNSAAVVASSGAGADGLIVSGSWNINSPNAMSKKFVEAYTKANNVAPDSFAAQGYAAIQVLLAAMKKAKTASSADIQVALSRIGTVETVLGPFGFDAQNEPTYPAAVQIVQGGAFTLAS